MKLKYRGQDYHLVQQQVSTIPSKNIACYRGHEYSLRVLMAIEQSQTPYYQMSAIVLKYRGVNLLKKYQFPSKPPKKTVHC